MSVAFTQPTTFILETTTPLGASLTFTGPFRDSSQNGWVGCSAQSDVTGTLYLDEAEDSAGNNGIFQVATASIAAVGSSHGSPGLSSGFYGRIVPVKALLRFVRVVVVNGAGGEARLRVNTVLSPTN